jgi:trafficking protein particle complex subunit 1
VVIAFNDAATTAAAPRSLTPPSVFLQTQSAGAGTSTTSAATGAGYAGLPFDEEAKLVYGVILSLRNMIKRLSGRFVVSFHPSSLLYPFLSFFDIEPTHLPSICFSFKFLLHCYRDESFVSYRTSTYKLHLFETVSGYRFVMLSDPNAESLRFIMRSIFTGPFLEYVVRNPLCSMDSRERGVDNEYFRASVDRLVRGLSVFQ